jgi:RNA polymerase sigma factor (sigma-70 family)
MEEPSGKRYRFIREWNAFIQTGDMHSLGIIYNNYFDLLYNYGKKFHFENQLIEDAIQNVFISLIKGQKRLRFVENPTSYLFCSFRNELFHLNSQGRNIKLDDISEQSNIYSEGNREEEIIKYESDSNLNHILNKCIRKLTPAQQEILFMRYDANFSYNDISRIINISVESCRTSVYRAVKTLKKDLENLKKQGVTLFFIYVSLVSLGLIGLLC